MSTREPVAPALPQPADRTTLAALAALFARAYSDYFVPLHIDEPAMRSMAQWYDFDLGASRVLVSGTEPVGFACLARRGTTGWIGGMGVPPEHRGRGFGEAAMLAVIAAARAAGLRTIALEVLHANTRAAALYERLGFVTTRDLDVWTVPPVAPPAEVHAVAVTFDEASAFIRRHRGNPEPWQRADATVAHMVAGPGELHGHAVAGERGWRGAAISRVALGRRTLLQLATPGGDEPVLRALLAAAGAGEALRWANVPRAHETVPLLRALDAPLEVSQTEMRLEL